MRSEIYFIFFNIKKEKNLNIIIKNKRISKNRYFKSRINITKGIFEDKN